MLLHEFTKHHQTIHHGHMKDIDLSLIQGQAMGEWAFSLTVLATELPSGYKIVSVQEIQKLLRQPYAGRIQKFATRHGIKL